MLGEVAHVEAGAEPDTALIRRRHSGDHLEQSGFAGTVAAHDGPAFAAADGEREAFVDHPLAVSLVDVFDDGHLVAGARGHAEIEIDDLPLLRHFQLFDLVQLLDAALHLGGFGGVGFEALNEALLLGEHGLLAGEGGLVIGFADDALALVEVVVAGVGDDFAGVDFRDLGDDAVHELAVMRGHQECAGIGL